MRLVLMGRERDGEVGYSFEGDFDGISRVFWQSSKLSAYLLHARQVGLQGRLGVIQHLGW